MKTNIFKRWSARGLAAAALLALSQNASATAVDLELSLVIDTSGSISNSEFTLQQTGYANAFKSAAVSNFIQTLGDNGTGGIAVNVIFFSTTAVQKVAWTQLDSAADSITFGNTIAGLARTPPSASSTGIARGMDLSLSSILGNSFDGARLTMDVSGDGTDNVSGTSAVITERNQAQAAGVRVNGLTIGGGTSLFNYYVNNVKTSNGFVVAANDFADFGRAAQVKILREVTGAPEPSIMALLGLGLAGFGLTRRQRRNS